MTVGDRRSKICIIFISLIFMISMKYCGNAAGDGVVIYSYENLSYLVEEDQTAFIDFHSGHQRMTVTISVEGREQEKSAWILPIPADPVDISYDIETLAPSYEGSDIEQSAREEHDQFRDDCFLGYLSSVIPMGRWVFMMSGATYSDSAGSLDSKGGLDAPSVEIHQSISSGGIHSELISAASGMSIYNYFTGNGISISEGMIDPLDHYIESNFSFIVTWIENLTLEGIQPGIYVEFPTDIAYYPMLLTGLYKDEVIPVNIIINGFYEPELNREIVDDTRIRYYDGHCFDPFYNYYYEYANDNEEDYPEYGHNVEFEIFLRERYYSRYFENLTNNPGEFTYIRIKSEGRNYIQDLNFHEVEPEAVEDARRIDRNVDRPMFFDTNRILSFIALSLITSIIVGSVVYRFDMKKLPMCVLLGYLNIVGIWVMIAASLFFVGKIKEDKKRMTIFVISYIITFLLFAYLLFDPLYFFI